MRDLKRVYIYKDNYDRIMEWAEMKGASGRFKGPSGQTSFPFYLEQYLMDMEKLSGKMKMARCTNCGSYDVEYEKGLVTVFRCQRCNRVGSKKDFEWR